MLVIDAAAGTLRVVRLQSVETRMLKVLDLIV